MKIYRVAGSLNKPNTKMIMANIAPQIEMMVKVFYLFKSVIYRSGGETKPYSKTLDSAPCMFTSLKEIQTYIEECEQKRLNLDNKEEWSQAYLPTTRTTEVRDNYERKVVLKHVQIRLVASNEPLMACGPLPGWLRNKRCICAINKFDGNLCFWRCLAIYKQKNIQRATEFVTRTALNLVRENYDYKNLKKRDVRPTKLADFEGVAKHHNVNIMLYEPKKDKGKNA